MIGDGTSQRIPLNAPSVAIQTVKWYANGALVRDNDIDAPYDMFWQGYSYPAGSATAKAVVVFTDGVSVDVSASFTKTTSTK